MTWYNRLKEKKLLTNSIRYKFRSSSIPSDGHDYRYYVHLQIYSKIMFKLKNSWRAQHITRYK